MKKFRLIIILAMAMAVVAAHAQFLELNINSDCNQDIFIGGNNDLPGTDATALYTLNTAWGEWGINKESILATALRSSPEWHYNGYFVNTPSDSIVVSTGFASASANPSSQVHLDCRPLVPPASLDGDTISSITFDSDNQGESNNDHLLTARTVAPVPEPTPYLMFGLGALVLAFGRWRSWRSRKTRQ
jgi:hypothetical protein